MPSTRTLSFHQTLSAKELLYPERRVILGWGHFWNGATHIMSSITAQNKKTGHTWFFNELNRTKIGSIMSFARWPNLHFPPPKKKNKQSSSLSEYNLDYQLQNFPQDLTGWIYDDYIKIQFRICKPSNDSSLPGTPGTLHLQVASKNLKGEPDMFNHHAGGFHQLANLWTKYPKFHQSLPVTQAIPEKMDRLRPPIEAHTRDGY